jgi:hypothetical protein
MLSLKALKNKERAEELRKKAINYNAHKVIECNSFVQTFNWQLTNRRATYKNYAAEGKLKQFKK